jgi:hypothetical protein
MVYKTFSPRLTALSVPGADTGRIDHMLFGAGNPQQCRPAGYRQPNDSR